MKAKEELNALKEELEALSRKLQELTEEELAQVSGGVTHLYAKFEHCTKLPMEDDAENPRVIHTRLGELVRYKD